MRKVAHGEVWFPEPVKARVLDLMKAQSSAARSAYQAIHKHGLKGNAVKQYVKHNFMDSLNQRYVSDAVSRVAAIKDEGVLFGGNQAWKDMLEGKLSKEEWQERRNGQLYSRGDKTKSGNPNIRVVGDKLLACVNQIPGVKSRLEHRPPTTTEIRGKRCGFSESYQLRLSGTSAEELGWWMYKGSEGLRLSRKYDVFAQRRDRRASVAESKRTKELQQKQMAARIVEMCEGGASYQKVADSLNAEGGTNTLGQVWTAAACRMLCRRARA